MFKRIIGFLIPLVGIFLLFRYLYSNREESEVKRSTQRRRTKVQKQDIDVLARKVGNRLNDRQSEILKLFKKRDILLPSDIYAIAPELSTRTLRRDMNKLVELDLVKQEGSTKDTRYILKN